MYKTGQSIRSFFDGDEDGHLDFPRARKGGLGGGFFAAFVPAEKRIEPQEDKKVSEAEGLVSDHEKVDFNYPQPIDPAHARKVTGDLVDLLFSLENDSKGKLKVVRTAAEVSDCLEQDILAAVMHFEGAEAIRPDLSNLDDYCNRGLRSLGLVWSRSNAFGHGVPFLFPNSPDTGPGLTPAGKALVRQCNRKRILVDLSHLNERGFWDVTELSDAPLVATHSGAHAMCESTRNLTDEQLDAIGRSGGIVGINFHVGFLRADGKNESDTPVSEITRHVDYIARRIGIDHVALGSDFDGAEIPAELGDVSGLPKLVTNLREQGYNMDALRKITHGNWVRVLRDTWGA